MADEKYCECGHSANDHEWHEELQEVFCARRGCRCEGYREQDTLSYVTPGHGFDLAGD